MRTVMNAKKMVRYWNKNKAIVTVMGRRGKFNADLYWTNVPGEGWKSLMELKYHNDWTWIMTAVEYLSQQESCTVIDFLNLIRDNHAENHKLDSVSDVFNAVYNYITANNLNSFSNAK